MVQYLLVILFTGLTQFNEQETTIPSFSSLRNTFGIVYYRNNNQKRFDFQKTYSYIYEDKGMLEKLIIQYKRNSLIFKLHVYDKLSRTSSQLIGTALLSKGDNEMDSNEFGEAYDVDEYIYFKKCWISFRVDKLKKSIKLTIADCEYFTKNQKLQVNHLLRRQ